MSNINQIIAALLLSPVWLLGGCDDPAIVEQETEQNNEENRAWTGYTSEEYPPLICPDQQAVLGVDCDGGYCDNVSLYCNHTGRTAGAQSWQPFFSEEGSGLANEGHCYGGDMWMSGIACGGGYCDNISMLCTQFYGSSTGWCAWSGWYSEEQGPFIAPWGYFVKGIECSGDYCDNMRYQYCWMY